jgi:hypothetical protein
LLKYCTPDLLEYQVRFLQYNGNILFSSDDKLSATLKRRFGGFYIHHRTIKIGIAFNKSNYADIFPGLKIPKTHPQKGVFCFCIN